MADDCFNKKKTSQYLVSFLTMLIAAYQIFSRGLLPRSCRFAVSCSDYSVWVIKNFGPYQGARLAVKRLLSCHPF